MIGQIIYLALLVFVFIGLYYCMNKGLISFNSIDQSIPVEYEVLEANKVAIITLTSKHGSKYSFLVDTGASANYIDELVLTEFEPQEQTVVARDSFYGIEGNQKGASVHTLQFTFRNSKLIDNYLSANMSVVFSKLSADIGREIHGILGIPFLRHHGFSLDVNRMMVWKKL